MAGSSSSSGSGRNGTALYSSAFGAADALSAIALRLSPGMSLPAPVSDRLQVALSQPQAPNAEKKEKHLKVPDLVKQAAMTISATRGIDPSRLLSLVTSSPDEAPHGRAPLQEKPEVPPAQGCSAAEASSMLAVALPEAEFTYIERPWEHFTRRWAAIVLEMQDMLPGDSDFTMIDLGSCCGFFSLQTAVAFPQAFVVGIEGSVGIGNGTQGIGGNEDQIIATQAIQTHLRWIQNLSLSNCLVAPEVWNYNRVCKLASLGVAVCDIMLSLSVVHHIDNVSEQNYEAAGFATRVDGTLHLLAKLLLLAKVHFIELPDRPWIEHMYVAFGSARRILDEAVKLSGKDWHVTGPLCTLEWYGKREVWLLEDSSNDAKRLPREGLRALFPRTLGQATAETAPPPPAPVTPPAPLAPPPPKAVAAAAAPLTSSTTRPIVGNASGSSVQLPSISSQPTPEELGAILLAAPTALIAAHVHLREAMTAAEDVMHEIETDDRGAAPVGPNASSVAGNLPGVGGQGSAPPIRAA
mmetsp:Transcript_24889/g.45688  ORF Transcript_24889/g.45688 Transcript_24889/m.45688 type:complete len:523 (+) Transcript_24889:76-1644(+)